MLFHPSSLALFLFFDVGCGTTETVQTRALTHYFLL
jgi:hypothetical protein